MATFTSAIGGLIPIQAGGTGVVSFTAYSPVVGGTTSTGGLQSVSTSGATAGQVLTYVSGSAIPTWQNSAGSLAWTNVSTSTATLTANTATTLSDASSVIATLDASANFSAGNQVHVSGIGAGGYTIAQLALQQILGYNGVATTAGTGGSVASRDPANTTQASVGCAITIRYLGSNLFWVEEMYGNFLFT